MVSPVALHPTAARIAFSFLMANQRLLRLPTRSLEGRALALQVADGEAADGAAIALPAFLAMVSALRQEAYLLPVAAVGMSSLHGHLTSPADLLGRVGALRGQRPGVLVLGPVAAETGREIQRLLAAWRIVSVPTLAEALEELGG